MKPVELIGHIDEQHRLLVELPPQIPLGPVRIVLQSATEENEEGDWRALINHSWAEDWSDSREDIYSLEDGVEEDQSYMIPQDRFDDPDYIERRVRVLPTTSQGAVRTALSYLYLTNGPTNLQPDRRKVAEPHLERA
jgi:hypothetical protein